MREKTIAQLQAEWVLHGNIGRLQAQLDREPNPGKRKALNDLLVEQRSLVLSN
jgi:hypothetical protein